MYWVNQLKGDSLSWLLEEDQPGVRYLALRDLLDVPETEPEYLKAQKRAHHEGPIAMILNEMNAHGFWVKEGPGYLPKYRSTVWSVLMLAQLGASIEMDDRIEKACGYIFDHTLTKYGQFLCGAMLDLGFSDPRLEQAFEWMARSLTGDGVAAMGDKTTPIRYYAGNCGPGFVCGANNKLPCAWGAVKVMLAFGKLQKTKRTRLIDKAIQQGINFLLSVDPLTAAYPTGYSDNPSRNWWKFGFPVFYVTDVLQTVEALARLGLGSDPRLTNVLEFIRQKQDNHGRWPLEYHYSGKTWVDFGQKKQPNKWVTYRAAWILKHSAQEI